MIANSYSLDIDFFFLLRFLLKLFTVLTSSVHIQLQQINFMSLMQIVQSSFANLPNVQQILQQQQSDHLEGCHPAHSAKGNGPLKTQLPTQEDKGKPGQKSPDFQPRASLRDESDSGHIKVGISKCHL